MNVSIRTDASLTIGTGHVMRCLTLAETLRDHGAKVQFISRETPGDMCQFIKDKNFLVHHVYHNEFDPHEDAKQTIQYLLGMDIDWLVVDHYHLDEAWESQLRPYTQRIFVIDDLANRKHDCDLLLNQNLSHNLNRYKELTSQSCHILLGPQYALLRPEFHHLRKNVTSRSGDINRILVFFGGSDITNETGKTLKALMRFRRDVVIDVVIGQTNPHRENLRHILENFENTTLHVQTEHMAQLIAIADLAIGAGGSAVWERCCLGLPSIVISVADNQHLIAKTMAECGYLLYLGNQQNFSEDRLLATLHGLNPLLLSFLSKHSQGLVDGLGAIRVMRAMQRYSSIHVRHAKEEDSYMIFEWRNSEKVRLASLNTSFISFEDHQKWFDRTLSSPKRKLLIGEFEGKAVGVIRFDFDEEFNAEVSIYLDPSSTGQGLGAALLSAGEDWLLMHHPEIQRIKATVKANNQISQTLFQNHHYKRDYIAYSKRIS